MNEYNDDEVETFKPEVLPPENDFSLISSKKKRYTKHLEFTAIPNDIDLDLNISQREAGIMIGGLGMALVGLGAWLLYTHNTKNDKPKLGSSTTQIGGDSA